MEIVTAVLIAGLSGGAAGAVLMFAAVRPRTREGS